MSTLVKKFKEASFVQLPREENIEADILAKAALARNAIDEYEKVQYMSTIDLPKIQQVEGEENWMTLTYGRLPEDKDEARRLRIKCIDEVLYKKGFSQP